MPAAPGRAAEAYIAALQEQARALRLDQERYWDILLQYKPAGKGKRSLVDDPKFFLAPDGAVNPRAELAATLDAFFQPIGGDPDEHPQCRFSARYAWLKERLAFDEKRLPSVQCAKRDEAIAFMRPYSATLVFPAARNNSPSSMFGHTLIRIDSRTGSDLLSHAATYAAVTGDKKGFLYPIKGIFGYYPGYYSNLPYYGKVAEYSDIEWRDIWEYELDLTQEEVRRMVLYLWELKDIYSDYYFFDENCSYNLLFLIEAARPSVRLTDAFRGAFKFWVIPSDTIRAVKDSGLVSAVRYRPSRGTRILFLSSQMDEASRSITLGVAAGSVSPRAVLDLDRTPADKQSILDVAAEVLQYRYADNQLQREDYLKRFLDVLAARSTLGAGEARDRALPVPAPPEAGHLPGKLSAGGGYRDDSFFTELGWRPAYHDLMDPDDGYVAGQQINFFDVRLRYIARDDDLRLQRWRLIDIVSLSGRSTFYHPVSWKVNTGLEQEVLADGREHLIYRLNPGGGLAYRGKTLGFVYSLLETDVQLGGALHEDYSIGLGASVGLLSTFGSRWKVHASLRGLWYRLGDDHETYRALLDQAYKLSTNTGISLSLMRERSYRTYSTEISVTGNVYF